MNLPPLPPSNDEFWKGEKFSVELKPNEHKHKYFKVSPTEIKCNCGGGFSGANIDQLLKLLTTE